MCLLLLLGFALFGTSVPALAASAWRSPDGDIVRFKNDGSVECTFADGRIKTGNWKWQQRVSKVSFFFGGERREYYVFIEGKEAMAFHGAKDQSPDKWVFIGERGGISDPSDREEGWFMAAPSTPQPTEI